MKLIVENHAVTNRTIRIAIVAETAVEELELTSKIRKAELTESFEMRLSDFHSKSEANVVR